MRGVADALRRQQLISEAAKKNPVVFESRMKTSQPWVKKADPSRPSQLDVLGASSGDILAVMMELKVGPVPVVLQKQVKYWSVIPCLLSSIDQSGGILGEPPTYSQIQRMQGIHKPTVEDIEQLVSLLRSLQQKAEADDALCQKSQPTVADNVC